jgi:hypothetical protein
MRALLTAAGALAALAAPGLARAVTACAELANTPTKSWVGRWATRPASTSST